MLFSGLRCRWGGCVGVNDGAEVGDGVVGPD